MIILNFKLQSFITFPIVPLNFKKCQFEFIIFQKFAMLTLPSPIKIHIIILYFSKTELDEAD